MNDRISRSINNLSAHGQQSINRFMTSRVAKMHLLRVLMQSSMLRFSMFLLGAIFLVPFDTPKTALAQLRPPGPNPRFHDSDECDYPDDEMIRAEFTAPDPDETVVFADFDGPTTGGPDEYCFLYQMKWVLWCFPENYLTRGVRSQRWYLDFYFRFNVIYFQAAQGWVYLLSRADGPRETFYECAFWFRVQFPTLKANEAVEGIVAVNINNYEDQWIYWQRGDGDQPRQRPRPDGDNPERGGNGNGRDGDGNEWGGNGNGRVGDGNGWGRNAMNAVTGVVGTGLTNLQTGALRLGGQAWRAVSGGRKHPTAPAGDDSKDRKDQPNPGTMTDVLNLKIGELPELPVGIDEKMTMAATDPTSTADDMVANDLTSGGGMLGDTDTATFGKLFGRRHRIMHSRADVGFCNVDDWVADPWNPDFPGDTSMPLRLEMPSIPASSLGPFYPIVPGEVATLLITQYQKQFDSHQQSMDFHLDITVLDPARKVLFAEQQIDTPSRQEMEIDAHLTLPLYVEVDGENTNPNPISIRYGDPPWTGVKWNSDDESQDHRCVTDPKGKWGDKRQIMCLFKT